MATQAAKKKMDLDEDLRIPNTTPEELAAAILRRDAPPTKPSTNSKSSKR